MDTQLPDPQQPDSVDQKPQPEVDHSTVIPDKPDQQLILLKENIENRITSINSRRNFYRKSSFFVYIITAIFATISTILLGLHLTDKFGEGIRVTTLIISCIITLINIYNAFFNYKDLWIANNDALNQFYSLRFNVDFYEKGTSQLDPTVIQKFKEIYQTILNDLNQVWQKSRSVNNTN